MSRLTFVLATLFGGALIAQTPADQVGFPPHQQFEQVRSMSPQAPMRSSASSG